MSEDPLKTAVEWTTKRKVVADSSYANLMFIMIALSIGLGIALGIAYLIESRKKKGNFYPAVHDPSFQHGYVQVSTENQPLIPLDPSKAISSV